MTQSVSTDISIRRISYNNKLNIDSMASEMWVRAKQPIKRNKYGMTLSRYKNKHSFNFILNVPL